MIRTQNSMIVSFLTLSNYLMVTDDGNEPLAMGDVEQLDATATRTNKIS